MTIKIVVILRDAKASINRDRTVGLSSELKEPLPWKIKGSRVK